MSGAAGPIDGAWCAIEEAGGVLRVRWGGEGFAAVKADFRARFPSPQSSFYLAEEKRWAVPGHLRHSLQAWAARWFHPDARTWTTAAAAGDDDELADAYAALHLLPSAPVELVESARRVLARVVHPDAGGSHEAMVSVNAAADAILAAHR